MSKLCQGTHSLDAIESHDEALQLPHVLDYHSKAGLYSPDILYLVILNLPEKRMLISEEVLHKFFDRAPIAISKNLNEIFHFDSLKEVAGSSQMFVLCSVR